MNKPSNPAVLNLFENHNPWVLLFITLGATMVGFQFLGAFLGLAIALPFYSGDMLSFTEALMHPTSDQGMRVPLLIMQGVGSFTGFILMPWILMKYFYKGSFAQFAPSKTDATLLGLSFLIIIFFMGVNAPFIEWNQNVKLPEFMSGVESSLKAMEEMLAKTSKFITQFDNIGQLLLGIVVVAIIPGIGEELVFRGLVQNHVYRITKNIHVAIWIGALLFSLFHLQFYGLIPRMFLGAIFGYMYYFSGNIIYPMIAHFVNNGFTLIMLYLYQNELVEFNIEATDTIPWPQVIVSVLITSLLFLFFQKKAIHEKLD